MDDIRPFGRAARRGRLACMTSRFPARASVALFVACLAITGLEAQGQKRLTLDAIYGPEARVNFSGAPPQTTWLDDATYLVSRRGAWMKVDAVTGDSAPLFDAGAMENA